MNNRIEISCYNKHQVNSDNGYSFEELKARKYFIKAHHYKLERLKKRIDQYDMDNRILYKSAIEQCLPVDSCLDFACQIQKNIHVLSLKNIQRYIKLQQNKTEGKNFASQDFNKVDTMTLKNIKENGHSTSYFRNISSPSNSSDQLFLNHSNRIENVSSNLNKHEISNSHLKINCHKHSDVNHNSSHNSQLYHNDHANSKNGSVNKTPHTKKFKRESLIEQKEANKILINLVNEDPFDKDLKSRILQAFQNYKFVNHNYPDNFPPIPLTQRVGYYIYSKNLLNYRNYSPLNLNTIWNDKIRCGLKFNIDISSPNNCDKIPYAPEKGSMAIVQLEKLLGEGAFAKVYKSSLKLSKICHTNNDTPQAPLPFSGFIYQLSQFTTTAINSQKARGISLFSGMVKRFSQKIQRSQKRKRIHQIVYSSDDEDGIDQNGGNASLTHNKSSPKIVKTHYGENVLRQTRSQQSSCGGTETILQENCNDGQEITKNGICNLDSTHHAVAVKAQSPKDTNWEFYIYSEIINRLALAKSAKKDNISTQKLMGDGMQFFPKMYGAFVYLDVSLLLLELYPNGTLLNLVNTYKSKGSTMPEALVAYFTYEILNTLCHLHHSCEILHTDVKPDNFLLGNLKSLERLIDRMEGIDKDSSMTHDNKSGCESQENYTLKLTDFGKSIDLKLYPINTYFAKTNEEADFQCPEMIMGKPWNYHLDSFGTLGTVHCMIFNQYMKVHKDKRGCGFKISKSLKRGWAISTTSADTWKDFFEAFLNLDACPEKTQRVPSGTYFKELYLYWAERFEQLLTRQIGPSRLRNAVRTIPRTFFDG